MSNEPIEAKQDNKKETDGKEEEEKLVPFSEVYKYADGTDKVLLSIGMVAAVFNGWAMPAFSEIFGELIGNLAGASRDQVADEVAKWAAIMTYVGLGVFLCSSLQVALPMYSVERQMRRIRSMYVRAVLSQEVAFFDKHSGGEVGARLSGDTRVMQDGMGEKVSSIIYNLGTFVGGLTFGFINSWKLTLVVIGTLPLIVIAGGLAGTLLTKFAESSQKAYADAGTLAVQCFENIRTVHALNGASFEIERYKRKVIDARKIGVEKGFIAGGTTGLVYFIAFGSYSIAFWYTTVLVNDGERVADLLAAFFAALMAGFSLGNIGPPMAQVMQGRGAARKIFETIDREPPIDIRKEGKKISDSEFRGKIEFKNVTFSYPTRPEFYVLHNFNLVLEPGKSAAFAGASGCGKSSIVALVQRFYDPDEGEILIDGVNLKDLDLVWWRNQVGIVAQEPSLFSGTVMSNVQAGNQNITDDDVQKACKDAFIHETIMKLPDGYNTDVGSLGTQLSGGQKQRLAIARALVKKPRVLLLDEATSALDRSSEIHVQRAIDTLLKGTSWTTIVIAHRLVTICDCHRIYLLDRMDENVEKVDGEVVKNDEKKDDAVVAAYIREEGTFKELVDMKGKFASLAHAQVRSAHREEGSSAEVEDLNAEASILHDKLEENIPEEEITEIEKPEDKKAQDGKGSPPFSRIFKMNMSECWAIILGSIGAILSGSLYPFYAVVYSQIVTVLTTKTGDELDEEGLFWSLLFLAVASTALVGYTVQFGFFGLAGEHLTERLRCMLFEALVKNEIAFFDEPGHEPGSLGNLLSGDTEAVHSLWGPALSTRIQMMSTLVLSLSVAFYYSWKLALVCLTVVPAVAIAGFANFYFANGNLSAGDKNALDVAGRISHEATANVRTVLAYNMHDHVITMYDNSIGAHEKVGKRTAISSGFMFGFGQFVMFGAFSLAFWYGSTLIRDGEEDFASVMNASMSIIMAAMGMGESSAMGAKFVNAEQSAIKIFALIDRIPLIDLNARKEPTNKTEFALELKNVQFCYPTRPKTVVLKDVCLDFPMGQHVGMMGSTGCGKSTIIQLLLRLYDPSLPQNSKISSPGVVSLNGVDLRDVGLWWWRSQVAIVSQEPSLFEGTIRDNITFGLDVVSDDDIEKAARLAKLYDDVMAFPDKFDTQVGSKGSQLSGGQKQRVAIARAIVRKPKVLFLDEATSALDNKSEADVQEAIDKIIEAMKMTVVTIAHRMTAIEKADTIVVMDSGVVAECGSHEVLMQKNGDYAERYNQYHSQSH